MTDPLISLLTALADDELVLGHRHSEWTGFTPYIEEDVAFSSIAQDEIGHATAYYELICEMTGDDPNRMGLGRDKHEYRNAILCERKNQDWAFTLARHWLYDTADQLRLEALEETAHEKLRALVHKMRREERYHVLHADAWMKRIAEGPVDGRSRLIDALHDAFSDAFGLFEPMEDEADAFKNGWLPMSSEELGLRFRQAAEEALEALRLPPEIGAHADQSAEFVASSSGDLIESTETEQSPTTAGGFGGRRGEHSADFDQLWDDLTYTYRHNPGASW
jgi:ring-1,2-phenylacetyl-CoA epoxidase subunit PaaC